MFKFITERPLWVNILTGILLAVGLFSIFVFSLNLITHHDEIRTVPQVIGKSLEQAEEILEDAGFEVIIQDSIYTDTSKPNIVLKQFPDPDEVVKVNRRVFLTLNRAVPPMVEMPNLVGYSLRNAEMTLANAGLRLGDTMFKPDFARNAVLEQRYHNGDQISPGTKVRMGTKIDFVLGSGVGKVEFAVPNLIGMTFGQAKSMLDASGIGFASIIAPDISDTINAYIYKQNPERYNEEKKLVHIRPGQTMDVWLQREKPSDSTSSSLSLDQE